jgi:hypothetical protein
MFGLHFGRCSSARIFGRSWHLVPSFSSAVARQPHHFGQPVGLGIEALIGAAQLANDVQTGLMQKPECDEGQCHDDVNHNCIPAQDDR